MITRQVLVFIENVLTLVSTAAVILGIWWMGGGPWGFLGLALLLNVNTRY